VWLSAGLPGTDWQRGGYYADRKLAAADAAADDLDLARRLRDRSALMCGLRVP
jgi:hypothetical protein